MNDPLAKIKQKLLEEIDQLSHELNVDLPKEIAVARRARRPLWNAEYKYAKERQGYVNARIGQLKKTIGRPGHAEFDQHPERSCRVWFALDRPGYAKGHQDRVQAGEHRRGRCRERANLHDVAIGKALLNRKVGDEIEVATPAGKKEFEVVHLLTIHDEA